MISKGVLKAKNDLKMAKAEEHGYRIVDMDVFKAQEIKEKIMVLFFLSLYTFLGGVAGYLMAQDEIMAKCVSNIVLSGKTQELAVAACKAVLG